MPDELSTRHRAILRRIILGESNREIGEALEMSVQVVHEIVTSPLFLAERTRAEEGIVERVTDVKARILRLAEPAVDVMENILRGRATMDGNTNLERLTAQDILDRAGFGKIEKKIIAKADIGEMIRAAHKEHKEEIDVTPKGDTKSCEGQSG